MAKKKMSWSKISVLLISLLMIGSGFTIGIRGLNKTPSIIEGKEEINVNNYTFYYDSVDNTYSIFAKIDNGAIHYNIPVKKATTRFAFRADPRNMSYISIDNESVKDILYSHKVYIAYDPNEENISKIAVAGVEIARLLGIYNIPTTAAYTKDANPIDPNVPLRTCEDATNTTTVIILGFSDEDKIYSKNNCVLVSARNADELITVADKLGMNLIGIKI